MIVARIQAQPATIPPNANGETVELGKVECFDLSMCNQPAGRITDGFDTIGSSKTTAEGGIKRDIVAMPRQWTIEYDYMTAEQHTQLMKLYALLCAGHCFTFTILNECECVSDGCSLTNYACDSTVDIRVSDSEISRWQGGREGVTITLKESTCGDC